MRETFPEFIYFQEKDKLNYPELRALLLQMIHLRATWNMSTFKATTKRLWSIYSRKLDYQQKVILQQAIVKLRGSVYLMLVESGYYYLSKDVILREFNTEIASMLVDFNQRQHILRSYVSSHIFP